MRLRHIYNRIKPLFQNHYNKYHSDNHVWLVLHRNSDLYLEAPITIVVDLVLKPFKFLRYLGWSILGIPGDLQDVQGVTVDLESTELIPKSTYHYCYHDTGHPVNYISLTLFD